MKELLDYLGGADARGLSPDDAELLVQLERDMSLVVAHRLANPLEYMRLTPMQIDILNATAEYTQIACLAANQAGKTHMVAPLVAWASTGRYPDRLACVLGTWALGEAPKPHGDQWVEYDIIRGALVERLCEWRPYTGRRWPRATRTWLSSHSGEKLRDILQSYVFGPIPLEDGLGRGTISKAHIGKWARAVGSVTDVLDYVKVRHTSGAWSHVAMKTAKRGVDGYTGDQCDLIVCDEIHPYEVVMECIARTTKNRGTILLVYSPADGHTELTTEFYQPGKDIGQNRKCFIMSIFDASFYTREMQSEIEAQYPPHERLARAHGIPAAGSGMVLPFLKTDYAWRAHAVPPYWHFGIGIDLGLGGEAGGHPTAVVFMARDPDRDHKYVLGGFRTKDPSVRSQKKMVRDWWAASPYWSFELPAVFWPHDGEKGERGSGTAVAQQYADDSDEWSQDGLPMWETSACYDDDKLGAQGDAAYIKWITDEIKAGQFHVADDFGDWMQEQANWHWQDGKIVARNDDLMKATKYCAIMRRHWRPLEVAGTSGIVELD